MPWQDSPGRCRGRATVADESRDDAVNSFARFAIRGAVDVERLICMRDREFVIDNWYAHVLKGGTEDSESTRATVAPRGSAGNRHRFGKDRAVDPRQPIDRVLQQCRVCAVVFRGGNEEAIGSIDNPSQSQRIGRNPLGVLEVTIEDWQRVFGEIDEVALDALRYRFGCCMPGNLLVERSSPSAPRKSDYGRFHRASPVPSQRQTASTTTWIRRRRAQARHHQ
jgi:hypothetical protein